MTDVVVVGGGLGGLAVADRLVEAGAEVTLLEASDRLGGKIYTTSFAGRQLDMGAEVLLTRERTAIDLCRELSLGAELVTPTSSRAHLWSGSRLRPLPAHAITRPPGGLVELLSSGLLSPLGLLRCGWDLIAPSRAPDNDVTIGALVRSRLGREVLERIVDPLLGGIHAGRCDTLSAAALAPHFIAGMGTGKGLVRGLRANGPAPEGAAFATLRTGLGSLAAALAGRAQTHGATVRLGVSARQVHAQRPGCVRILQQDGETLEASACVLATPAGAAARMLAGAAPAAAAELSEIVHAPAAIVALAYPAEALAGLPEGTGFVTAGDQRLVRACTWSSSKWEHLSGDPAIVKAFVGRAGAPGSIAPDRDLAAAAHRELTIALKLRHAPVDRRVVRFGAAIPQYFVGHLARVDRIEAALPRQIAVAGASYRGAGLSACLRSGRAAAEQVIGQLRIAGGTTTDHPLRSIV